MNKYLKWTLIGIVSLAAILFIAFRGFIAYTKSHSPEETVTFNEGAVEITITYSRPFKKGRNIFGELVPYNKVWRTGANECTVFTTATDLSINGKTLPAGKYSLFTIPGESLWHVIWNEGEYSWGVVDSEGTTPRVPEQDALVISAPVSNLPNVVEQFTISVEKSKGLVFTWDQTEVSVSLGLL